MRPEDSIRCRIVLQDHHGGAAGNVTEDIQILWKHGVLMVFQLVHMGGTDIHQAVIVPGKSTQLQNQLSRHDRDLQVRFQSKLGDSNGIKFIIFRFPNSCIFGRTGGLMCMILKGVRIRFSSGATMDIQLKHKSSLKRLTV